MRKVLLASIVAAALAAQPAWAEIGRIKSHVGAVSIQRGGTTIAARPGLPLEQGDVLVTGKTGRIGIAFLDNTRMAIGPGSKVTLTQFAYDRSRQTGSFLTSVKRGSLGVVSGNIAKSRRDAMRVETPRSMLGVRGTKFVVEVK